jgi:formate/nitrite transporter
MRRLPREVVLSFLDHAEEYLAASPGKQATLAFAAGSFIAFGAVLSVFLTVGVAPAGVARLLLGLGFAAGFTMVVLSGAALFTEINVLLPVLSLERRGATARLARFWVIVYVGNLAGALFVGGMIDAAHVLGPEQLERLREIIVEKTRFHDEGGAGWLAVVASGVLGNWLVGMAAFIATAARTVPGKILGILFPIVTFVALGVQHSPANMGYFAVGLIHGDIGTSWGEAFAWNLVPATLGNLVGGAILVALLFWYTFGSDPRRRRALLRAQELVRGDGGG